MENVLNSSKQSFKNLTLQFFLSFDMRLWKIKAISFLPCITYKKSCTIPNQNISQAKSHFSAQPQPPLELGMNGNVFNVKQMSSFVFCPQITTFFVRTEIPTHS